MPAKSLAVFIVALATALLCLTPASASGMRSGQPARWIRISPRQVSTNPQAFGGNNYGFQSIAVDPKSGAVYVGTCYQGLWKSTNEGRSWDKVNTGANGDLLDSGRLWSLVIDPVNPQVLYTTAGYGNGGVLKSTDGGVDWTDMTPSGSTIENTVHSTDIYSIAIDPRNHNHILASFHGYFSAGSYANKSPILESKDGGVTWSVHTIGSLPYPQYVYFLGNSSTWLVGTTARGFWRTTNAGSTWKQVSTQSFADGGSEAYEARAGDWYVAAAGAIMRSRNGGRTWKDVGIAGQSFMGIVGDGKFLYTAPATTGGSKGERFYFLAAPESNGTHWVQYNSQAIYDGPMSMAYDPVHHLVYSSNWRAGVWKLDSRRASIKGNSAG